MASKKEQQKQLQKDLKKTQKTINQGFKQAEGIYDTQLADIRQAQPEYERVLSAGFDVQKPIFEQQAQKGLEQVGMQKEQTKSARETALSSARRTYEEGLQRSQQLFGGVGGSSAGQASAEVIGAQTQRTMGQARQQSEQTLSQLGSTERDINANLSNKLAELEVNKTRAITQARDLFRQEINTIQNQKGALALNKAQAQLQALSDFNANRRRLDEFYATQKINLENYAQQSKMDLQKYEQQLNIQSRYPQLFQSGGTTETPINLNSSILTGTDRDLAKRYINQLITSNTSSELLKSGIFRDQNYSSRENPGNKLDVLITPQGIYDRNTAEPVNP